MSDFFFDTPLQTLDVAEDTEYLAQINDNLNQLTGAAQIFQVQGLTQQVAVESSKVMGLDLLNTMYSVPNLVRRNQLATESFFDKFIEMIKHAFRTIIELVKKCINWIRSLFRRNKLDPEKAKAEIKKESQQIQQAMGDANAKGDLKAVEKKMAKEKLAEQFVDKLTPIEFALAQDASPYHTKIRALTQTVQTSKALEEIQQALAELNEWYAEQLKAAGQLEDQNTQLEKIANGPKGLDQLKAKKELRKPRFSQFHEAMSKDAHGFSTGGREETDVLFQQYYELRDILDHLPKPSFFDQLNDLPRFFERVVQVQADTVGSVSLLKEWDTALVTLQKTLETEQQKAIKAQEEIRKSGQITIKEDVHYEYFNALNTIPQRILNISQIIAAVYQSYDAETRLFAKTVEYVNRAAHLVPEEELTDELHRLQEVTTDALKRIKTWF